jgi:hypothetical protein
MRIDALSHPDIKVVEADVGDMDEDLIRPHRGFLHVDNAKNLGAAMAIDSNCFHANDL